MARVPSRLLATLLDATTMAIRVDASTNLGSILDMIVCVLLTSSTGAERTACSEIAEEVVRATRKRASRLLMRLLRDKETIDLSDRIVYLRINGQGPLTPCTDAETMIEIAYLLPGMGRDLRQQTAQYIRRLLISQRHASAFYLRQPLSAREMMLEQGEEEEEEQEEQEQEDDYDDSE